MRLLARVIAIALFAACASGSASERTPGEAIDDSWLLSQVTTELIAQGSNNINVEVNRGVVQLAGFVDLPEQRKTAERAAAAVQGVKAVSNRLVVQSTARSASRTLDDGVIATKVKSSLAESEKTSAFRINVEVREGVVLLSGYVASSAERQEAAKIAGTIDGVNKVINGIDIVQSG